MSMMRQAAGKLIARSGRIHGTAFIVAVIFCSLSLLGQQLLVGRIYGAIVAKEIASSWRGFATSNLTFQDGKPEQSTATIRESVARNDCDREKEKCRDSKQKEFPRICLDSPLTQPRWEWHNFSENGSQSTSPQNRLLIAQYSAFGKYARLLELTSPINKEYARRWKFDMVVLQGTTLILPDDEHCTPPEERSRFNKVHLLLMALSIKDYDQILILDADTLIYDFSYDITALMPSSSMLVAQRIHEEDSPNTTSINNGVTLWNLRHPRTPEVAKAWDTVCRQGIPDNRPFRGDQYYLRQVLKGRESSISAVWNEFYYRDATVVKHFQRSNPRSWNDTGLDSREERIDSAIQEIVDRFGVNAHELEYRNYTAIEPMPWNNDSTNANLEMLSMKDEHFGRHATGCKFKRPKWEIYRNKMSQTVARRKRLLIAQYSGYGSYMTLLKATAPINLAYAKYWKHDMIVLEGTALVLKVDDPCDLAPEKAMYNKIPILALSLAEERNYDQVLILDADAMIVNLEIDITQLLGNDVFLAAQRVNPEDSLHTWNINNGATLWDLHHPLTRKIAKKWFQLTVEGLTKAKQTNRTSHGDQNFLHRALRREKGAADHVNALSDEFRYNNGTVVKHFVRQKNSWDGHTIAARKQSIDLVIPQVCRQSPHACENLQSLASAESEEWELPTHL